MDNRDFFEMVQDIYGPPTIGQKMMIEFNDEETDNRNRGFLDFIREYSENDEEYAHYGIRSGTYYSQYTRLAVYMEWKHNITSNKNIRTHHAYELLEYLRFRGFKDATLKGYIIAVRRVYNDNKHLFSDEFALPSNSGYEQYRKEQGRNM